MTTRALLLLIEDLVLWTRLREGRNTMSAHDAASLVMPAVALHRTLAERGGVELVVDVPEHPRVRTDLVLAQTLVRLGAVTGSALDAGGSSTLAFDAATAGAGA